MIARVWRGATRAEDAEAYAQYVEESGMQKARELPGARGTLVLRRVRADRAEFETIILFDSLDDVRGRMSLLRAPNPKALERWNYIYNLDSWYGSIPTPIDSIHPLRKG